MKKKLIASALIAFASVGSIPANAEYLAPDSSMVDGIKIQTPTRVQAGKYFQIKLTSRKGKFNGICWWQWDVSKGFSGSGTFKMKKGSATTRVLPIQPGAGTMSFLCGTSRSKPVAGGYADIYIAP